ncbi:MAG: WD40 repeat domain-containing protein, partial [Planctomycetia bacterium]
MEAGVWTPDGKRLATAGRDGAAVWNAATGERCATIGDDDGSPRLLCLALTTDGRTAVAGGEHRRTLVFETATGAANPRFLASLLQRLRGATGSTTVLAFNSPRSSRGTALAMALGDPLDPGRPGRVWVEWRLRNAVSILDLPDQSVWAAAWSPTRDHLAVGTGRGLLTRWDAARDNARVTRNGKSFRADFLTAAGGRLPLVQLDGGGVRGAAFSPDGRTLFAAAGSVLHRRDAGTLAPSASVDLGEPITAMTLRPDGAELLVGLAVGTVTAVDAASMTPTASYDWPIGRPAFVA